MTRTRDRSQDAKNISRREQVFEVFTSRVSSQFERVEMKTAIINNEEISAKIERIIRQADSASKRERRRDRERERKQEREREQERDRTRDTRDRDRERDETMKNENEDDEMKDVLAAK
jgi:septal ring factor EnvC (AmiA/AmiB activator)